MGKELVTKIANAGQIPGWGLHDGEHDNFEIGLELESRHPGKRCAFIKSISDDESDEVARNAGGHLSQTCGVDEFKGERIRMTAWVKSALEPKAIGRLELMSTGKWGWYCKWNGTFDNMSDRQITGSTDWTQYCLVVDVPEEARSLTFGAYLIGVGKLWLDEVSIEIVDKDTPLTGLRPRPINLNFEE